ncbi:unnamed protein product [Brugia timori]|uniref:Sensor histidine kinase n=1 Tax=Brugia timori TaxID=42155 RepID=A0A0R3QGE9_9BILA|nr:unnamed protein product [Brugia timori]
MNSENDWKKSIIRWWRSLLNFALLYLVIEINWYQYINTH